MRVVLIVCSLPFIIRTLLYIKNIILVYGYMKNRRVPVENMEHKNVLILIPVLREQNVIRSTIDHFVNMQVKDCNIYLMIAGTKREGKGEAGTTLQVVEGWIEEKRSLLPHNIDILYCESNDDGGDRATQLNYAVEYIKAEKNIQNLDYIGVYDADSLPSLDTLEEVIYSFSSDSSLCACQQPVHFIETANRMASNKENPALIANALYQTTWTVINEFPMWIKYYRKKEIKLSRHHLYLIGHGEFMTKETYDRFRFPEYEITDGIQLGYRLGMSNKKVKPLCEFCNDDVPHQIKALIKQHKRWFGGCMNLLSAYKWSKKEFNTNARLQVLDGLWSQARWAWTSMVYVVLFMISLLSNTNIFILYLVLGLIYCYIIPIAAHRVLRNRVKVRLLDWICLPIAIFIKSIGPNWYLFDKILRKKINYEKVER